MIEWTTKQATADHEGYRATVYPEHDRWVWLVMDTETHGVVARGPRYATIEEAKEWAGRKLLDLASYARCERKSRCEG